MYIVVSLVLCRCRVVIWCSAKDVVDIVNYSILTFLYILRTNTDVPMKPMAPIQYFRFRKGEGKEVGRGKREREV